MILSYIYVFIKLSVIFLIIVTEIQIMCIDNNKHVNLKRRDLGNSSTTTTFKPIRLHKPKKLLRGPSHQFKPSTKPIKYEEIHDSSLSVPAQPVQSVAPDEALEIIFDLKNVGNNNGQWSHNQPLQETNI